MRLLPYPGSPPEELQPLVTGGANDRSAGSGVGDDGPTARALLLHATSPATPGGVAHVSLSLKNDNGWTNECTLCVTDLIGVSGHRIPASHVRVSPNPARVQAAGSTDVQIEVRIPSATPAGRYTGLLQADGGESLQALVQLIVGIDSPSQ